MSTTHTLVARGAAFSLPNLTRVEPTGTGGSGVAVCNCGWRSEVLPSGKQRVAAHKAHRADPAPGRVENTLIPDEAEAEVEIVHEAMDNPAPGQLATAEDQLDKDLAEVEPVEEDLIGGTSDDFADAEAKIDFPGNYSIVMAPFAVQVAEAIGGLEADTRNVPNRLNRIVTVKGSRRKVTRWDHLMQRLETEAFAALRVWQKENIEKRRKQTDMQRYLGHREFLAKFGKDAAERAGRGEI